MIYKSGEFIDGINITADEVYSRIEEELPTTSMPSVQDACDLYDKLISEGYTHAYYSSNLFWFIRNYKQL
ncbi:MAG: DegV family protein [Clostridium sp.]|nr:DegV family protein [Clostridium sp.]